MRWRDLLGIIDIVPSSVLDDAPFDLFLGDDNTFVAFFRVGARYDFLFSDPDWATLDAAFNSLPRGINLRFFTLVDRPEENPFPATRPFARHVLDHFKGIDGREVDIVLGITYQPRLKLGEVFSLENLLSKQAYLQNAGRMIRETAYSIHEAYQSLTAVLDLHPMSPEEWSGFVSRYIFGVYSEIDVQNTIYSTAFLDRDPHLSRFFPVGEAVEHRGVIEVTRADGTLELFRMINVLDFPLMVKSDFMARLLGSYPWPFRMAMDLLSTGEKEMRWLKIKMNVYQAMSGFGWRAGELERGEQWRQTEEAFMKILKDNARIWRIGLRFLVPVTVPADEDGMMEGYNELRRRTARMVAALRNLSMGAHVERLRMPYAFIGAVPSARTDVQRTTSILTEVATTLLPVLLGQPRWAPNQRRGCSQCNGRGYQPCTCSRGCRKCQSRHMVTCSNCERPDVIVLNNLRLIDTLDLLEPSPGRPPLVNRNLVVTGQSGQGKSFLLQVMLQFLAEKYGNDLFIMIVETGGSFRRFIRRIGGEYVPVGEPGGMAIDPLVGVDPEDPESIRQYALAVRSILSIGGQANIPEYQTIYEYAEKFFSTVGLEGLDTWSFLEWSGLDAYAGTARRMLNNLIFGERIYRGTGRAAFIELPKKIVSTSTDDPDIERMRDIVNRALFSTVMHRMMDPNTRYTLLVIDEGWTMIRSGAGQGFFDYAARAFRKHGGGIWVSSQSMQDFVTQGDESFARMFLNNCYTKILFHQVYSPVIGWLFPHLNEIPPQEFWSRLAISSMPGHYSEALFIQGNDARIIRFYPSKEIYDLFNTDRVTSPEKDLLNPSAMEVLA